MYIQMMLSSRKLAFKGVAAPCKRCVLRRAAAHESPEPSDPAAVEKLQSQEDRFVDSSISPVTGNPQTGKLIDVYFEVGAFLAVVAMSFWSMYNVKDVVDQTAIADSVRQPAVKTEWLAMDNKDVRTCSRHMLSELHSTDC